MSNPEDVPSPALLIYVSRVEENIRRMIQAAGGTTRLRPHVKTHKLPQIIEMHLRQGIDKFKAATIAESEMAAAAGARDVLLAHQPVGPGVERFAELNRRFPKTKFHTIADCAETLQALSKAAQHAHVILSVLIDLNVGMNRTGIEPGPAAADLYRRLCNTPGLMAGGLHAYDGHLKSTDHEALSRDARSAFDRVLKLREELRAAGLPVPLTASSGTPTFPILAASDPEVEVGAGTTVLWDAGQEAASPDLKFEHAAVLLTRVISKPLPGRVCLDLGHKSVASEMPQPRVRFLMDAEPVFAMHSEEHLALDFPLDAAAGLSVGSVVYAIPKHVCPTVALHNEVYAVREGRAAERWPVTARARRITV
ncbi:MAG: D-TA family PLP-dependent enzyme [Verrucomicrobia bacterium]|nr:D-TA family PLP-dependent enzyme [Verrucomicrobiota bacterium]